MIIDILCGLAIVIFVLIAIYILLKFAAILIAAVVVWRQYKDLDESDKLYFKEHWLEILSQDR